jgi:hypothetical protein
MKKITLTFLLGLIVFGSYAQDDSFEALMTPQQLQSTIRSNQMPVSAKNIRTIGSVYWIDSWLVGNITTTTGKEFKNILLKYNAFADEILFKKTPQDKDSLWAYKPQIQSFSFTHLESIWLFKPEQLPNKTEKSYLRVLYEGKTSFLARYAKVFYPADTQVYSNTPNNTIEGEITYFLKLTDGKLIKVNRKKGSFLDALAHQKDKLKDFIKTEKIDFDKDEDIIKLLTYYETL